MAKYVRPDVATMTTYKGVETLEAIAAEIGIPVEKIAKLNANENVYGPPAEVAAAVAKAELHTYPDPSQQKLREAVAKFHGVSPDRVVAGAGSDDILDILIRVVGPSAIVISTPTFGMYSFLGKVAGAKVVDVPRREDFTVDVAAVKAAIKEHKATIAFLPSPNNPTGTVLSNEDAKAILEEDCILVVDEAYADFCGTTAMDLVDDYDNLVVTRTLSKWAGLAGLRLGYSVASADISQFMMAVKQPYNVNAAAEAGGLAALEHRSVIMSSVDALRNERDRLFAQLQTFDWMRPVPSEANFILCEIKDPFDARSVYDGLRTRGVIIRYFGSQGGDLSNYVRFSAGKPEHTDMIVQALKEIEAQKASS